MKALANWGSAPVHLLPRSGDIGIGRQNSMDRPTTSMKSHIPDSSASGANVKNPVLVQARREALVRAAVDVFCDKGYHPSRIIDVANAAGVSHGTIYNYVGSKED